MLFTSLFAPTRPLNIGILAGGKVVTKEVVTAYILDGSIDNGFDG